MKELAKQVSEATPKLATSINNQCTAHSAQPPQHTGAYIHATKIPMHIIITL